MICTTSSLALTVMAGRRARLRCWQWAQALMQARFNGRYELSVADKKQTLFAGLDGDVLEIGPGTGVNLVYLPVGIRWIGIEPNTYMHGYLRELGAKLGLSLDIRVGTAEQLPVPANSMDAVISTQVPCSVAEPAKVLQEIQRVLKPGGRFLFLEHVAAARGTSLRRWQRLARPISALLGDGCHPDRETWSDIEQAGFAPIQLEHFEIASAVLSKPHIAGVATKQHRLSAGKGRAR
ncbi:MAG TPA: class I SAM-dependent methyltransferase [Terriglobia bacterium]|nr:class I SAM-dependent methyltransferase [Terriglobia bacterium]